MNEVKIDLGNIIKRARLKKGLSQCEIAQMIGVTSSLISRWESNKRTPETYDLLKLTNILDIGSALFLSSNNHVDEDIPPVVLKKLEELTSEIRDLKEKLQLQHTTSID